MSASDPNSAIYVTDSGNILKNKVRMIAYMGDTSGLATMNGKDFVNLHFFVVVHMEEVCLEFE